MTQFLKVEGNDSLVRDVSTKAIINTNKSEYENYIRQKKIVGERKAEIERQNIEINSIKSELSEVKSLLMTLIANSQK
jgi:hypothetical protein